MPIKSELRHLYRCPEWEAARQRTRERSRDRCELCKRLNGTKTYRSPNGKLGTAVAITIQCGCAHIVHNDLEHFYDDSNLAWLCRGCHLRFDLQLHLANARATRCARKDAARPLLQAQTLSQRDDEKASA